MDKAHTNGAPSNPDIRHERTDADVPAVVKGGVYLIVVLSLSALLTIWVAWKLTENEAPVKKTELPPSKADKDARQEHPLPDPPLEALDDLRRRDEKNFHLYPSRAAEDRKERPQPRGVEKAQGSGLFPVRQGADAEARKAPAHFSVQLPSRSSAGRRTTGGQ